MIPFTPGCPWKRSTMFFTRHTESLVIRVPLPTSFTFLQIILCSAEFQEQNGKQREIAILFSKRNLRYEEGTSAHKTEVPFLSQYHIISWKTHHQMNTGENNLSSAFSPAAFLFPLQFSVLKFMEGYTATSYKQVINFYRAPYPHLLTTSMKVWITPEFSSHTHTCQKEGGRLRCPHHDPTDCARRIPCHNLLGRREKSSVRNKYVLYHSTEPAWTCFRIVFPHLPQHWQKGKALSLGLNKRACLYASL